MGSIKDSQRNKIISLLKKGKLSREQIAEKVGVSPWTVSAIKAHLTMGTYNASEMEEVIEAMETNFRFERDLQIALRQNIEQLEQGLKIIDEGKEQITEAGRIDITAVDKNGKIVVIELKAGIATFDSIAQILSYMGVLSKKQNKLVRGILVAGEFPSKLIFAAYSVPNLQLKKYNVKFSFKTVK